MSVAYEKNVNVEPVAVVVGADVAKLRAVSSSRVKIVFLVSLLLCTWLPVAFFLTFGFYGNGNSGFEGLKSVFLFLGAAHVQATLFFYSDRDFRTLVRANRARYIYFPIALILASGLLFAFAGATAQAYLFLIYWAWQAHHYGRQNVGIYAFVAIAQKTKPQRMEKLALELATWCAIFGTFKILGMSVAPQYLHASFNYLYQLGYFSFLCVIVFSVLIYLKNIGNTTTTKTLFFFTLLLFFFPIFISNDINVTFLSYAIAHGLQYIIFMTVVSLNPEKEAASKALQFKNMMKLSVFILIVGFIFYRVGDLKGFELVKNNFALAKCLDFLVGAVVGATMAHFVVDAGAWRLSRAAQRAYMTKRFAFIFNQGDVATTAAARQTLLK